MYIHITDKASLKSIKDIGLVPPHDLDDGREKYQYGPDKEVISAFNISRIESKKRVFISFEYIKRNCCFWKRARSLSKKILLEDLIAIKIELENNKWSFQKEVGEIKHIQQIKPEIFRGNIKLFEKYFNGYAQTPRAIPTENLYKIDFETGKIKEL